MSNVATLRQAAMKEQASRMLERKYALQRDALYEMVKAYWLLERKETLDENRHIELICDYLERVFYWEIKRLIINVPPRSLKTELVSIAFPNRCWIHDATKKFMEISYSAELAEKNSWHARNMYLSATYTRFNPRKPALREDQNTKQHWENILWWQYYAAGSSGTITGVGTDILIIDDPLNPEEATSDVKRQRVNHNYHDTLWSRLNSKIDGAIIIIQQRLHDDDLSWHLLEQERLGTWEKRHKLIIPAIAEEDEQYRKAGESFFPKRFPREILDTIKMKDRQNFSSQYQQNPIDRESQEFHEERFRYHWTENVPTPGKLRIFTTCDPAFKQGQENDNSCIMTAGFLEDRMYILEYSVGKWTADVLQEKLIYHIRKRSPEKVGIEAFQAQTMIKTFLQQELNRLWIHADIEEIRQTWDKLSKIRRLVSLYKNWLIYHKYWMDELELELKRFPRGKHDDIIDAEQMLYDMYELQPNTGAAKYNIKMERDQYWRPIPQFTSNDRLNG